MAARHRTLRNILAAGAATAALSLTWPISAGHVAGQRSAWRVDSTLDAADRNPGDGLCGATSGGCTLRAAIQEANAEVGPGIVELPAGHYTLTVSDPGGRSPSDAALDEQTGDLDVRDTLTLEGAGADVTVVDGDRLLPLLQAHSGVSIVVRGVGFERGSGASGIGGSCLYAQGPAIVDRAAFTDCGGVALWAEQSLTVTASRFEDNEAGIIAASALYVGSSTFVRHHRGAINANGGPTWIDDTTFTANAGTQGSALDATGDLTVRRSTFASNGSTSGALAYHGRPQWRAAITDSAFISNTATSSAAIDLNDGRMTITNSTFAGNVGVGGTPISVRGQLTLTHVTLHGGDLEVDAGSVILHNTLLVGARCVPQGGTILSLGHNVDTANTCGLDPALGDRIRAAVPPMVLADNGGPTLSMLPADAPGMPHPALDAADPAACPATDQRGFLRPAGGACDIGAVERGAAPGAPTAATPPASLPTRSAAQPTPTGIAPGALPASLVPVARLGGAITDLVVFGDLAARAAGTGVTLLDLTDPDAPRALGRLELDAVVAALAGPMDGGDLVALAGGDVVRVDVSDPERPTVAGRIRLPALPIVGTQTYNRERVVQRSHDVAVRGTTVVVAIVQENPAPSIERFTSTSAALATLDLAAPENGWTLAWQSGGTRSPFVSVLDVAVSETRLFAVLLPEMMFSPRLPTIVVVDRASGATGVAMLRTWDGVAAITPDGNDVWLAAEPPPGGPRNPNPARGLLRLDAADAAQPRLGVTVTLPITLPVRDVVLRDRTAWLLAGASADEPAGGQLWTVDIGAPSPTASGLAATLATYGGVLAGDGDRLLVGDDGGWVRVVSTADRTAAPRGELPDVGPVAAVALTGGRLLTVGTAGAASLGIVDVARADEPRWTASWGRTRRRVGANGAVDLAVEGDTAWVADGGGLSEIDLARPDAPRPVHSWLQRASGVERAGGKTYVVGHGERWVERGLMTADIDAAGAPRLGGPWFPNLEFQDLAAGVDGGLLSVSGQTVVGWGMDAGGEPRVRSALDLDLSAARGRTWRPATPCCVPEVSARPGLGAVANGDVTLFDPSSAPELRILGTITTPSRSAAGVALHGDLAVIAAGYDGVAVVDVRAPDRPVVLAMTDTPGIAGRIALDWPLIYVADSDAGITVLRFTDVPPTPDPAATATQPPATGTVPPSPTASPTPSRRFVVWLPFGTRP